MTMRIRGVSVAVIFAVLVSLISAVPAEASTTDLTKQNLTTQDSASNAVGLIVKYKNGVSSLAPNGEATGENFAGVSLDAPVAMGDNLAAIPFSQDLTDTEALAALDGMREDPRVVSVQFDRFVEMSTVRSKPIQDLVLPKKSAVSLPIVIKSAVKLASLSPITAQDSWSSGVTPRVTVRWSRALSGYSGSVVGYRVQIYSSGAWRTLKSQTASTTRSYTTSTSYLKAGTPSRFRVAAITKRYGRSYVGYYKYVYVTPTTAPRTVNALQVQNNLTQLKVSWTPYTRAIDTGGLAVTYSISVRKPDLTEVACVGAPTPETNTCNVSDLTTGASYTVKLTVSNAHGSVVITKVFQFNVSSGVSATSNPDYSKQWYLKSSEPYSAKVSDAWATESGLEEVVVAVLDTGYTDHPDLPSLSSRLLPGYDFISSTNSSNDGNGRDSDAHDVGDFTGTTDSSWHGTHVAGIVTASDNTSGVVGIAPHVKLLPVRVLGADGGTTADIISGIYWAAGIHRSGVPDNPNKADVINMSIGGESIQCDSQTQAALAAAKAAGVTVVTSAGNDNGYDPSRPWYIPYASLSYPGNCYPTINIGSSGKNGTPAFYSNFSNAGNSNTGNQPYGVDLSAPGGDYCQGGSAGQIYSTLNSGATTPNSSAFYAYEIGTSMAAPVVSGVVALMYSAKLRQNPSIVFDGAFVEEVWDALATTATPFLSQHPQNCVSTPYSSITDGALYGGYGPGIVNADGALAAILQ